MEISPFQCKYTQFSIIKKRRNSKLLYHWKNVVHRCALYGVHKVDFTVSEKLLDNIPAVTQPVHTFSSVMLISLCNFICCVTGNEKKKKNIIRVRCKHLCKIEEFLIEIFYRT